MYKLLGRVPLSSYALDVLVPTATRVSVLTARLSNTTDFKVHKNGTQKLIVSDSCMKRLREICENDCFLRVTVEGGGCSGFQYKFELDKKLNEDDQAFGEPGAKVVIDNLSLEYCSGGTVDYHTELIRSGFRMLSNPNAEQGCSCGASFSVKLD